MGVILVEKAMTAAFDALASHPFQIFAWGEAREKLGGQVMRFGVQDSAGKLTETYQMTVHKLPRLPYFLGYVPRSGIPSETLLVFLKDFCKKRKIILVMFEPDRPETSTTSAPAIPSCLVPAKRPLFYTDSIEIDLTKSSDQLKQECSKKTRYNINFAEKNGITTRELFGEEAFSVFCSLFFQTVKRKHFGGRDEAYHRVIWETMSARGVAKMLVAYHNDTPLAVYELFCFGKRTYSVYSGSSSEHRELKAKNLLLFRAFEFGRSQGNEIFNMWGVLGNTTTRKGADATWKGFSDFKKGYGGTEISYPGSYDFVISPVLYFFYGIVAKILGK